MKEFSLRAKDGSDTSKEAFEELGLNAADLTKQFNKGGDTAKKAFEKVVKALQDTDDETAKNMVSTNLFGTQYEDLGSKAFDSLLKASDGLENIEGATQKASDALQDNFGVRATKLWRDFLTDMEPVGQKLLDVGEKVLPKVSEALDNITGAFINLSPEGQNTVLIIGGIVAAIGPLLTGLGFAAGGVGALSGALTLLTGPVGITVAALAGLGLGFLALDKEMDKPIIKSDIFAGEISKATEKAVGSYMKLDTDATAELNNLALSQATITQQMSDDMVAKYQEMGDKVLVAMQENHVKQLEEQQSLFDRSAILTEEEEAKRIAKLKANQLKEIEAHNENQARIKEIWTTAAEEKRGITDAEAKEIAKLQEQMRTKAVEELSASQQEQETILRNLKTNKSIIETETAANTVSKSLETRNKVVGEANKQYNQTVAWAKSARDDLGIISSEEAAAIISEAELKKDKTVAKAQDMHTKVVKEAQNQAKEHADEVNWETGQVLSGWDAMYNGVIDAVNWVRGLFDKKPLDKRGSVKENGRQRLKRQNAELRAYAKGTSSTGHPGGPAIVGEEGRELAHIPGIGLTMLGTNGPELFSNLPQGSSVLPNKQTESMLKSFGFPGYAEGIGDYFDMFLKGSGSVWDFMKNKFSIKDSLIPSWLNKHTGSPISHIGDMAKSWIKGFWDNWFGDAGGVSATGSGVQRWAGLATRALMIEGQYSKANLDRLLYQMQTESGGNPRAINLWDINAKRGTPSMGLLQTIMPTYQAYKHPQFDKGPYDPMSNILASIRYAMARYGSLARAYRGVGYEIGGVIDQEQFALLGEGNKEEVVIPLEQHRDRAMSLFSYASGRLNIFEYFEQSFKDLKATTETGLKNVVTAITDQTGTMVQKLDSFLLTNQTPEDSIGSRVNSLTKKGGSAAQKYFDAILEDGDWMNDWATHVSSSLRKELFKTGYDLAKSKGFRLGKYADKHLKRLTGYIAGSPIRTDSMKLLALADKQIQGNKHPDQFPSVGVQSGNSGSLEIVIDKLSQQVQLLTQLVLSAKNIENKPVLSEGDIGRAAERYDAGQAIKSQIFKGRKYPK